MKGLRERLADVADVDPALARQIIEAFGEIADLEAAGRDASGEGKHLGEQILSLGAGKADLVKQSIIEWSCAIAARIVGGT